MYKLVLHPSAEKIDLATLWQSSPEVAAEIAATLELIRDDQDLLDSLTDHGFGSDGSALIQVSKWQQYWRRDLDLWRFKIWNLENLGLRYRVIYYYAIRERCYYVLAIVQRDFDYDPKHEVTQRILSDCAGL